MSALRFTAVRVVVVSVAALGGALVGVAAGVAGLLPPFPLPQPPEVRVYPLPHHVPKYPGGVSLRFAMVHDVLHERFPRHGDAYYAERNRAARRELEGLRAKQGRRPQRYYDLLDDLGAGLERLGQHDESVRVLRDKLREQQGEGLRGRALYTTYANLGTFLIHGGYPRALRGDASGKQQLREGLKFIRHSITVNPEAHFGREVWQAVAVEFLLAALDDPRLPLRYDLIGDRLDRAVSPTGKRSLNPGWGHGPSRAAAYRLEHPDAPGDGLKFFRRFIATVGAEEGWGKAVQTSHKEPVPFDEPVLGIIGMWRLGGGANPHFALALGEVMLRVGQRYIAWCAYERAVGLAGRFSPDPGVRAKFIEHCRGRQALIEGTVPPDEVARLRPRFQAELKYGLGYQKAYQDYEAGRIAAGASTEDPHFYDAFHADHAPIASPVGGSDRFLAQESGFELRLPLPAVLLFSGLFAFAAACELRRHINRLPGAVR